MISYIKHTVHTPEGCLNSLNLTLKTPNKTRHLDVRTKMVCGCGRIFTMDQKSDTHLIFRDNFGREVRVEIIND